MVRIIIANILICCTLLHGSETPHNNTTLPNILSRSGIMEQSLSVGAAYADIHKRGSHELNNKDIPKILQYGACQRSQWPWVRNTARWKPLFQRYTNIFSSIAFRFYENICSYASRNQQQKPDVAADQTQSTEDNNQPQTCRDLEQNAMKSTLLQHRFFTHPLHGPPSHNSAHRVTSEEPSTHDTTHPAVDAQSTTHYTSHHRHVIDTPHGHRLYTQYNPDKNICTVYVPNTAHINNITSWIHENMRHIPWDTTINIMHLTPRDGMRISGAQLHGLPAIQDSGPIHGEENDDYLESEEVPSECVEWKTSGVIEKNNENFNLNRMPSQPMPEPFTWKDIFKENAQNISSLPELNTAHYGQHSIEEPQPPLYRVFNEESLNRLGFESDAWGNGFCKLLLADPDSEDPYDHPNLDIVINGTFAYKTDPYCDEFTGDTLAPIVKQARENADSSNRPHLIAPFQWTGENDAHARHYASRSLEEFIRENGNRFSRIRITVHSHGYQVAKGALQSLVGMHSVPHIDIISFAGPIRKELAADTLPIANIFHFYAPINSCGTQGDMTQYAGGLGMHDHHTVHSPAQATGFFHWLKRTVEHVYTTATQTVSRTDYSHSGPYVYNIRLVTDDRSPDHSGVRKVAPNMHSILEDIQNTSSETSPDTEYARTYHVKLNYHVQSGDYTLEGDFDNKNGASNNKDWVVVSTRATQQQNTTE